jgi:hypothetical protein
MQQKEERPPSLFEDLKQQFNIGVGVSQIFSKPVQVWLHRPGTWGDRFANYQLVIGFIAMWAFGPLCFAQDSQCGMTVFCLLTTAMLLVHRLAGHWNRRAIAQTHSHYSGTPWLPGDEMRVKTKLEPLLLICVGPVVIGFYPPLGTYLLLTGIALAISMAWQAAAHNARIRSIRDSKIEQEWLMGEMKKRDQDLGS